MTSISRRPSLWTLARHSGIYAIGDFVAKGLSLVVLPIYTRYLDPSQYGTLELLDLVGYVAGFVVAMGIAQAMTRHYQECDTAEGRNEVVTAALVSVVAASLLFLIASHFFLDELSQFIFGNSDYEHAFQLMFVGLGAMLIAEIPTTVVRLEQRALLFVTLSLGRTLVILSLSIWFVVFQGRGVYGVLYASCTTSVAYGVLLATWLTFRTPLSFKWVRVKSMLHYGLPLLGTWVGTYILHFSDRFFLQRLASLDAVGVYSVAYKFGIMPNFLILTPFMMMWTTRQFELAKSSEGSEIIGKMFTYFMFAQVYFVLGVSLPIQEAISVLTGNNFHEAARYIPLLMSSYIFSGIYTYSQLGLLNAKRTGILSAIVLVFGGVNVALNIVLVPRLQLWGATLATFLTFVMLALTVAYVSQKFYRIPYEARRLATLFLTGLALFTVGRMISFEHTLASLIARLLIAAALPLALLPTGFYSGEELGNAKKFWQQFCSRIGARTS